MPDLGALALATAMLIDTRWILNEELGILARSEHDAANDLLDHALAALNQGSDELAELAFELGASPAHPEALADALTHEVLGRARLFQGTAGDTAAETFFFAACALVLRELARAAGHGANPVTSVAAELTRVLEKRLSTQAIRGDELDAAANELIPLWRDLAGRISS